MAATKSPAEKTPPTTDDRIAIFGKALEGLLEKHNMTMSLSVVSVPANPEGTTFGFRPQLQFLPSELQSS